MRGRAEVLALQGGAGSSGTKQVGHGGLRSSKMPGDSAAASVPAHAAVNSLEPGPAQGKRQERKERMEWVPSKQLLPCPSTLSNFQLGFQLTGDMRLGVGQALTRRFPDTWRASDYPVITPFIASLQVVTFWQAFPWKGPFPALGSQHLQGNRQAHWTLLLQPCSIALPS